MGRNLQRKRECSKEKMFFFLNQDLQVGKNTDQLWSYKSFVQGWSGSKLKAKYGYKTITLVWLAIGGQREKSNGKGYFCLQDLAAGGMWGSAVMKPKDLSHPGILPLWKFGNLVPRLISETCSLEHQVWGKDSFVNIAPPMPPGDSVQLCLAL